MAVLISSPRGMAVLVTTLGRRPCAKCGRLVRVTLLPNYYDRGAEQWCLPCVRERHPR